jgi:hypothetical protein
MLNYTEDVCSKTNLLQGPRKFSTTVLDQLAYLGKSTRVRYLLKRIQKASAQLVCLHCVRGPVLGSCASYGLGRDTSSWQREQRLGAGVEPPHGFIITDGQIAKLNFLANSIK